MVCYSASNSETCSTPFSRKKMHPNRCSMCPGVWFSTAPRPFIRSGSRRPQMNYELLTQRVPELNMWSRTRVRMLARTLEPRRFPPGCTLYRQGDVSDMLWVVREGTVELTMTSPDSSSKSMVVKKLRLGAGAVFGEECLVGSKPRSQGRRGAVSLMLPQQQSTSVTPLLSAVGSRRSSKDHAAAGPLSPVRLFGRTFDFSSRGRSSPSGDGSRFSSVVGSPLAATVTASESDSDDDGGDEVSAEITPPPSLLSPLSSMTGYGNSSTLDRDTLRVLTSLTRVTNQTIGYGGPRAYTAVTSSDCVVSMPHACSVPYIRAMY